MISVIKINKTITLIGFMTIMGLSPVFSQEILLAAASDLQYVMEELIPRFEAGQPGSKIKVSYGSSGKFLTQIQQGAPFDLYFSADMEYPKILERLGLTVGPIVPYGLGRIVIYTTLKIEKDLCLQILLDSRITRIALANPEHAPYGKRAQEALEKLNLWSKVIPRLVLGENIAQAAQFVLTGNAQAGILALSLVSNPRFQEIGQFTVIPEYLHTPLEQGFVILKKAEKNALAAVFSAYISSPVARSIFKKYGFTLPGEKGQ